MQGQRGNILEHPGNVSPSELQNARPTGKHLKMFPRRPRRRPPRRRPRRERRRPQFWHLRANGETFRKMFPRRADRSDGGTFPHRRDGETFPIPPTGKHSRMFPRRGRLDGETLSTFPVSRQKCFPVAGTRALGECFPVGPAGRRPQQNVSPFLGFGSPPQRGNIPIMFPRCWHSSDGETFRDSRDGETFFRDPADGETFPPPGTQPGQRGNIPVKTGENVAPSDW